MLSVEPVTTIIQSERQVNKNVVEADLNAERAHADLKLNPLILTWTLFQLKGLRHQMVYELT